MTEVEAVEKHKELYDRAGAVGLTLKTNGEWFEFNIKQANGLISKKTLAEIEVFICGYELGYHAGL